MWRELKGQTTICPQPDIAVLVLGVDVQKDGSAGAQQAWQECLWAKVAMSPLRRQTVLQQLMLSGKGATCVSEVIIKELNDMTSVVSLPRLLNDA